MPDDKDKSPSSSGSSGSSGSDKDQVRLGDTSTADSLVSSARSERDDFHFGDDRAIGSPPNWPSYSSTQLYQGAVNNNEPGTAEELGAQWNGQGDDLLTAADMLYEAISEISGAWVGEGSGSAQGALIGVANASSTAGDAARTMGRRMQDQAAAAAEVKKMPPPKEFNVDRALAAGLAGGPAALAADMKAQSDEARSVQEEQQRYMNAYTKSMTDVDGATPSFGPESLGLKPVVSATFVPGSQSNAGSHNIADGSLGVSGIGQTLGGVVKGGMNVHLGVQGGGESVAADLQTGGLREPLATSGTAQVSTQGTGPGAAAALGTAALGAGLGLAGAKALGRDGKHDRKNDQRSEERGQDQQGQDQQGERINDLPADLRVREPGGFVPGQVHAVQMPGGDVPQYGVPGGPGQPLPQSPMSLPVAPEFSGGAPQHPQAPVQAPLTEGVTSGSVDHAAPQYQATSSVSVGTDHQGPSGGPQHQVQSFQQQAQAAGAMPPPVQPMGGHGAGMGASGAGAAGGMGGMDGSVGEHAASSYLIKPDPDDVFGPTEAVTSGVIGEDPEDD